MIAAIVLLGAALALLASWALEELITEPECIEPCGLPGDPVPPPALFYDQDNDAA